jgi:DNA-binding NtrC family response regulator
MPQALVVDDAKDSRDALAEWLGRQGFSPVETAATVAAARSSIESAAPDLILLDLKLPDGNGLELLPVVEELPATELVVTTGHGSIDSALEAFRNGAVDYLTKPLDMKRLGGVVARCRRTLELRNEVSSLRGELARMGRFGRLVGRSPSIQETYRLIDRVAPTSTTVFVTGETGTGKELVAATVHDRSPRAKRPFLPINCGAIAPNLIESELFGHEKGSFTGADRQHSGIFERANGGTLFLDEITEMPLELQVKLLRVLETGSVTRIGGSAPIDVDVRVIAASNQNLEEAVRAGKLRSDLFYRLNVFPLRLPPLRERLDDIELLATHMLEQLNRGATTTKRLSPAATAKLRAHTWPGNVRELKNVMERAYIISGDVIDVNAIPLDGTVEPENCSDLVRIRAGTPLAEAERRLVLATLRHYNGDKKAAARALGVSLKTLYNRLNRYAGNGGMKEEASAPDAPSPDR